MMMTKRFSLLISVTLGALILAGCTVQAAAPPPALETVEVPSTTSEPVSSAVAGLAERLNAGDLQGALAYYDDDAMFYIFGLPPAGTEIYSGKEQISAVLEENIASHFKMEIEVLSVYNDVVTTRTTTWHDFTRQLGVAPVEATDVYVIKDGKIVTEAWYISEGSLAKLKSALAEAMPAEPEAETPAEAPVSELTVTFAEGTCVYEDSLALQAGSITMTLDIQDLDKEKYAVSAFNLEPGKDFSDLMASTIEDSPPSWADMFTLRQALPGENSQFEFIVDKGPVYVVCWSSPPDLAIGAIGPFTVVE